MTDLEQFPDILIYAVIALLLVAGAACLLLWRGRRPKRRSYVFQVGWLGPGGLIGDRRQGVDFLLYRRVKRRYYDTPRVGEMVCLDDTGTTLLPVLAVTHENNGVPVLFLGHLCEDSENSQPLFQSLLHWGYKRETSAIKRGQATTVEAKRPALQATIWAEEGHLSVEPRRQDLQAPPVVGSAAVDTKVDLAVGPESAGDMASGAPPVTSTNKQPA